MPSLPIRITASGLPPALRSLLSEVSGAAVATFKARRDASVEAFRAAGFRCDVPQATMYLWIALPDEIPSALFADRLLEEEGVVVMPGSGFGAGGEGFFRISFITSPERLAEAAVRAGRVLASMTVEV